MGCDDVEATISKGSCCMGGGGEKAFIPPLPIIDRARGSDWLDAA